MQLKVVLTTLVCWSIIISYHCVVGDSQTSTVLNSGCSTFNASNLRSFYANINGTFSDLRNQISNGSKHFAIAQEARGEVIVYSLFQCRNYLSKKDCVACFNTASTQIRNCSASNGARLIYDGCFLRYESERFYDQTKQPGGGILCGNKTAKEGASFGTTGQKVLMDLQLATPKIKGFFAATKTLVNPGSNSSIYAIAQCVETATESTCLDCMTAGLNNLQTCLPNTDG